MEEICRIHSSIHSFFVSGYSAFNSSTLWSRSKRNTCIAEKINKPGKGVNIICAKTKMIHTLKMQAIKILHLSVRCLIFSLSGHI